jgi:hypothetical protein
MISQLATLHLEIFQTQSKYLNHQKEYLSRGIGQHKFNKNSLLERRAGTGHVKKGTLLIDPFEQALLQTLDANTQLQGDHRLNLFLLLMHSVDKVEQKLLCIYILRNHTPRSSHEKLVQSGLFQIINRWIQFSLGQDFDSQDSSGLALLTLLCHLLKECYFLDIDIAKKFDILKLIKKIGKVSSSVNSTEELQEAVSALKASWQEEVNKEDSLVRAALLKSKLKNLQMHPEDLSPGDGDLNDPPPAEQELTEPQGVATTPTPTATREKVSVDLAPKVSTRAQSGTTPLIALLSSSLSASQTASNDAPKTPVVPARSSHQPLNVVGKMGAHQIQDLIQMAAPRQPQKPSQRHPSDRHQGMGMLTRDESTFEILQQAMLPKIVLIKSSDVKGIMKKTKSLDQSTTTSPVPTATAMAVEEKPKPRRLISWNEKLFDIRYFEVEAANNMTKSTSRLRQDKEVHQKKLMTTTCDWKRPEKREVDPDERVDVHSFEESIQRKRLLAILQRFYPDDDDIPSDPEDDPNIDDEPIKKSLSDCVTILWENDEVPARASEYIVPDPQIEPPRSILRSNDQLHSMAEEKDSSSEVEPLYHKPSSSFISSYGNGEFSSPPSVYPPPSASSSSPWTSSTAYDQPRPDQFCRYHKQRTGCHRGNACPYIHDNTEKKRPPELYDFPPPKKGRSDYRSRSPSPPPRYGRNRSPSPPPRFGRNRSPSPPLRYGRVVTQEPNYFEPIPLRQTREQMKLSSNIYGADRAASPPSPPPLKNPAAYRKLATTVCSAYISGSCRYGYKCHYLHEQMDMFGDVEDDEEDEVPAPKISPNTWMKTIDRDNTVLIRMRGLPYDVSYPDILQFFTGASPLVLLRHHSHPISSISVRYPKRSREDRDERWEENWRGVCEVPVPDARSRRDSVAEYEKDGQAIHRALPGRLLRHRQDIHSLKEREGGRGSFASLILNESSSSSDAMFIASFPHLHSSFIPEVVPLVGS